MTLRQRIEEEIRRHGPIPFSRYMEMCLYDPELGYYSRNAEQFGKTGDFYTSSDVHAVFGRLLARQFEEMWRALGSPGAIQIVELGPGRGLFARDVLDWSEKKFPGLFRAIRYVLVESSPALRNKLSQNLQTHLEAGRVRIFASLHEAELAESAIVFANEFFDALPVEVVSPAGELRIAIGEKGLQEEFVSASPRVLEYLDRFGVHPESGERVEAGLLAQEYMAHIGARLGRGFAVIIDYGYTRDEQLAGRHRDTVMAYRHHTASANPYEAPGEQDITADVNFTAVQGAAREAGLEPLALVTQAQFLMGIGERNQFADAFEDCRMRQEQAKVALQLKHLVTPAGMGETFHVLVMAKGVGEEQTKQLSGLKFAR